MITWIFFDYFIMMYTRYYYHIGAYVDTFFRPKENIILPAEQSGYIKLGYVPTVTLSYCHDAMYPPPPPL